MLYTDEERYDEAEPLYIRALDITEKALGPEHPSTATFLNNLAGLYHSQGRYGEAEPLYIRALDITEEAPSETHSIDENDDGFNRKDFRIIIRSNDADSAKDLARELRSEGYRVTNVESDLGYEIISWNGLPEPLLEEILAMTDEHLDIDTDEILVLEDDELPSGDIFLDLLLLDDIDTSE